MDDDNSGSLTMREFNKACKDFKCGISEENVPALFKHFDQNGDGTIDWDEFLKEVRGDVNPRAKAVIRQAFDALSERCGGQFTVDYAKQVYDAARHPAVL